MPSMKHLTVKNLFAAAARTTTTTGSAVDLQGLINPGGRNMKGYLDVGAAQGTSPSITVTLQEGDNTTTFTDIAGAAFNAATTATNQEIQFRTNKRYVRSIATFTANTTGGTFGCYLVGEKRVS